jgi:hypothetical protein
LIAGSETAHSQTASSHAVAVHEIGWRLQAAEIGSFADLLTQSHPGEHASIA